MSNQSPAPGTPQTKTKAYVSTALSAAAVFVGVWVADTDPFTAKEAAAAGVAALVAAGLIGGATAGVSNKPL